MKERGQVGKFDLPICEIMCFILVLFCFCCCSIMLSYYISMILRFCNSASLWIKTFLLTDPLKIVSNLTAQSDNTIVLFT